MSRIAIVTDSTADLTPEEQVEHDIHVVPMNILFDGKIYQDDAAFDREAFFHELRETHRLLAPNRPEARPPTIQQFLEVYERACRETDADHIISLHISSQLSKTVKQAQRAGSQMFGQCRVHVVDSQLTTAGLGLLAKAASKAAREGKTTGQIIRMLRGLISHVYIVFFVETLDFLERGGRIDQAQAMLGTMLNIKPILMVEEGQIEPLEKVQTRAKALEKLAEFVAEFGYIETIKILHNQADPREIDTLVDLIRDERPDVPVEIGEYGPALAAHVGPDAMGVMVSEGMIENPWQYE